MKTLGFNQDFNTEEVAKDVEALIAKHYKGMPMSLVVDRPTSENGFFLMFAHKTGDKTSVRTFGNSMSVGQILDAFEGVMDTIEKSQRQKIPVA